MKRVDDLFNIYSGNKLDFGKMNETKDGIAFISRTSKNNGVVGYVEEILNVPPYKKGLITVSLGGTYLLSAFIQNQAFYTGQNVAVLEPKIEMSDLMRVFYCHCITMNRHKYSAFGREANKTLKDILIPSIEEIPPEFLNINIPNFNNLSDSYSNKKFELSTSSWKEFRFDELFNIRGGYYNKKPENLGNGKIPFISATRENNGITEFYNEDDISLYHKDGSTKFEDYHQKYFNGNCITVVNNGASVGYAFYQENDFTCSHDINALYLKDHLLNKYIAMFLITVIEKEKYRWNYGRKWRPKRMAESIIKLPAILQSNGKTEPDWAFMDNFIKSLPYSKHI